MVANAQVMTFTRAVGVGPGGGGEMPMDFVMLGGNGDPNGTAYWAQADLGVDGSPISGVTLTLQPGMTITGKVEFRSANVRSGDFKRVQLTLMPAPTAAACASARAFHGEGRRGPASSRHGGRPGALRAAWRRWHPVRPRRSWRLDSAVFKGRDILDFPLDVQPNEDVSDASSSSRTRRRASVAACRTPRGGRRRTSTIVVFAADKGYGRSVAPGADHPAGTDGKFTVPICRPATIAWPRSWTWRRRISTTRRSGKPWAPRLPSNWRPASKRRTSRFGAYNQHSCRAGRCTPRAPSDFAT
jgi:hypothetical protein